MQALIWSSSGGLWRSPQSPQPTALKRGVSVEAVGLIYQNGHRRVRLYVRVHMRTDLCVRVRNTRAYARAAEEVVSESTTPSTEKQMEFVSPGPSFPPKRPGEFLDERGRGNKTKAGFRNETRSWILR